MSGGGEWWLKAIDRRAQTADRAYKFRLTYAAGRKHNLGALLLAACLQVPCSLFIGALYQNLDTLRPTFFKRLL